MTLVGTWKHGRNGSKPNKQIKRQNSHLAMKRKSIEHQNTITTMSGHDFKAGDWITIASRDERWWRCLLHWTLMRQGYPQRTIRRRVSQVSTTTLTYAAAGQPPAATRGD